MMRSNPREQNSEAHMGQSLFTDASFLIRLALFKAVHNFFKLLKRKKRVSTDSLVDYPANIGLNVGKDPGDNL